jgi:hypothetical protein
MIHQHHRDKLVEKEEVENRQSEEGEKLQINPGNRSGNCQI